MAVRPKVPPAPVWVDGVCCGLIWCFSCGEVVRTTRAIGTGHFQRDNRHGACRTGVLHSWKVRAKWKEMQLTSQNMFKTKDYVFILYANMKK